MDLGLLSTCLSQGGKKKKEGRVKLLLTRAECQKGLDNLNKGGEKRQT